MTRMQDAKNGRVTQEMRCVARAEGVPVEKIVRGLASGRNIIIKNAVAKRDVRPVGAGEGLHVKINANIGTSRDCASLEEEIGKLRVLEKYGADLFMDLSTGGDLDAIRSALLKESHIPLGTVPIYQAIEEALERKHSMLAMTEDDLFNAIEKQLKQGVDFLTVHVGVHEGLLPKFKQLPPRVTGVVSRGGSFTLAWMERHGRDNPLHENFDYLLDLAREFDCALSLGDGMRPGCGADCLDFFQVEELKELGKLAKKAREANVQVMIEGPGHVPLHRIKENVDLEKILCDGAPFYILGMLVTDVGASHDHITGAIGGAVAGWYGADVLCYLTPAEHLALPTVEDVKEGTIAFKIAAHAADLTRFEDSRQRDFKMSVARHALDWETQYALSVAPDEARKIREARMPKGLQTCSMCGELCAMAISGKITGAFCPEEIKAPEGEGNSVDVKAKRVRGKREKILSPPE